MLFKIRKMKILSMFLAESGRLGIAREQARQVVFRLMCEIAARGQAVSEPQDSRGIRARINELYAEAISGGEPPVWVDTVTAFMRTLEVNGNALNLLGAELQPYADKLKREQGNYGSTRAPTTEDLLRSQPRSQGRRW